MSYEFKPTTIEEFNRVLNEIDSKDLSVYSRNLLAREQGLRGEELVYKILEKYCDKIHSNVVVWNNRHTFATEMDFICRSKNQWFLIEVKNWYGEITFFGKEKVVVENINLKEKKHHTERTNPIYTVGAYRKDFKKYCKEILNLDINGLLIKKIVVFTRDKVDFIFDKEYTGSTEILKLKDLDNYFQLLQNIESNELDLPDDLPSWDIFYSNKGFSLGLLLNDEVMIDNHSIKTSSISTIAFGYGNENSRIELNDGTIISGYINFEDIRIIGDRIFRRTGIQFMKLNKLVHLNTYVDK